MNNAAASLNSTAGAASIPQVYFWSGFGKGQEKWPIPSTTLLVLFFLGGCGAPLVGGATALVLGFLVAAFFPSKQLRKFFSRGDMMSILSVTSGAMIVGNFDALGDILGNETLRFSWVLLGFSALVIPVRIQRLRGRMGTCCLVIAVLVGFNVLTTFGNTELVRAVEVNGSYLAAYLLIMINLARQKTRDAFVFHLVLIIAVNCGFSLFELLIPNNSVSISSSKIGEETVRSAGIYANAIASGLMAANTLLLAAISSTKTNPSSKEKLAMFVFMGICGIGVLVTFSRSAALCIFMAGVMAAYRLSNNQFARLMQYAPFVIGLLLLSFFGAGEYLSGRGGLKRDATKRYDMVKEVMQGDVGQVWHALEQRMTAWGPSRKYWRRPKLTGHGFNILVERQIFPPHNMIILILVETGWIGLLLFIATVSYLGGFGQWKITGQNLALFASVMVPVLFITIESHALFKNRYFSIYMVMLGFTSSVLLQPGNAKYR